MVNWLTAFIAAVVAFIGLLQWITARQKVVLDLFDKRFAVYEELREVMGRHLTQRVNSVEDMERFTRSASRAQFLFGSEITGFLEDRRLDLSRSVFEFTHRPEPEASEEQRKEREDKMVARSDPTGQFFSGLRFVGRAVHEAHTEANHDSIHRHVIGRAALTLA